jgi:predicted house-cleaning noncanonical NTP pyrophosphatase (MazG superfamily)
MIIPEIIKNSKKYKVVTLSDNEFLVEMERKLSEEINEYLEGKSENELTDIIEVVTSAKIKIIFHYFL